MVYILRPYLLTNPHLMYMTPSKGMSNISFGRKMYSDILFFVVYILKTFLQVCQHVQNYAITSNKARIQYCSQFTPSKLFKIFNNDTNYTRENKSDIL